MIFHQGVIDQHINIVDQLLHKMFIQLYQKNIIHL